MTLMCLDNQHVTAFSSSFFILYYYILHNDVNKYFLGNLSDDNRTSQEFYLGDKYFHQYSVLPILYLVKYFE